jgi:hypothetical protein
MNDEKEFLKLTETGRKFIKEAKEYESPITMYMGDIHEQIVKQQDEQIMIDIKQTIGYDVDKFELIKALQYDREQYDKGYSDCKSNMLDQIKKVREEIQKLRGCSCSCSDGIIDDVEDILDELIESEG